MKILVTGASGFLGSHVVEALGALGHEVRALVRRPAAATHLERPGVEIVVGHLGEVESLAAAVSGCVSVVHCAGLTKARSEEEFDRTNVGGVARLLDAVRRAGGVRRFVLVSSLAAAGPSTADAPRPEDAPAQPITRYGRSKRRGEIEALGRGDVPVTIVRPPAIYGPRDVEILEAFRLARRLRFFAVIGAGETRVSMIYGPDCARAVATLALDLSDRSGAVYHVDDGGRWSWHELGAAIGAAVGVEIREAKLPDWAFRLAASVSEGWGALRGTAVVFDREKVLEMKRSFLGGHARIRADYGWTPEVSFPEGARRTAAWYREQGWL